MAASVTRGWAARAATMARASGSRPHSRMISSTASGSAAIRPAPSLRSRASAGALPVSPLSGAEEGEHGEHPAVHVVGLWQA